ncbi:MAG: cupredoxin domain-containing protein [Fimbriimonadaceae bacterium]|nr:cupredoxin domain-containing protein [Fimbriimonadaceae bacterium]
MKAKTFAQLAVLTLVACTLASGFQQSVRKPTPPTPAPIVKGVQTLTILVSAGKYSPSYISVKKGVPVSLIFKGGKNMGCGSVIEFKSLTLKQSVKEGKTVTFKFVPKKAGEIAFACPMNMYRGKVIVK